MHRVALALLYLPRSQPTQLTAALSGCRMPAGHAEQKLCPSSCWYFPGSQPAHFVVLEPADGAHRPAVHFGQDVLPLDG